MKSIVGLCILFLFLFSYLNSAEYETQNEITKTELYTECKDGFNDQKCDEMCVKRHPGVFKGGECIFDICVCNQIATYPPTPEGYDDDITPDPTIGTFEEFMNGCGRENFTEIPIVEQNGTFKIQQFLYSKSSILYEFI